MLFLLTISTILLTFVNFKVNTDEITQKFNPETLIKLTNELKKGNLLDLLENLEFFQPYKIFTTPELALEKLQNFTETYSNVSEKCIQDFAAFTFGLIKLQNWSILMLDAYGKIGSGIKQGNVIWPGRFSECNSVIQGPPYINLSSDVPNETLKPFHGQYCWITAKPNMTFPETVTSLEQFLNLKVAVCVPDSCSSDDLNILLEFINDIPQLDGQFILSSECIPKTRDIWKDSGAVISLVFCFLIILIILTGTIYDVVTQITNTKSKTEVLPKTQDGLENDIGAHHHKLHDEMPNEERNAIEVHISPINTDNQELISNEKKSKFDIIWKFFLCFSFYTNASKLFNTEPRDKSLMSLNGIRVISMAWIIFGHTYMMGAMSSDNILIPFTWIRSFWFMFIVQAVFSVDTFFFLSGLLVTYLYLKEHDRTNGNISWFKFYFHRYWRLTPVYAVVLFIFYDTLSPYYFDGPFWPEVGVGGENCHKYWWRNMLYINNFWKSADMCMGHTWYLANDMQFYIISPLILIFITRCLPVSAIIAGLILLACWITTGSISTYNHIGASLVDEGATAANTGNQFDLIYDKPYCRIGPYIIGMICGYLLHQSKCKAKLNKTTVAVGWLIAAGLSSAVMFGIYDVTLNQDEKSLYNSMSRSAWSVALAWTIYACCNGYGGIINTFFSWPFWQPFARLTYATYLIHLAIIPLFVSGTEVPPHFSHILMFCIFFASAACSYFAAIFISLAFEAPFMALEKLFL